MSELIIWCVSISLESLVLFRSIRSRLTLKYPFFYASIIGTLILNALLLYFYLRQPDLYRTWYWPSEFLTLVLACAIILEIFRHVLSPYPGAERLARITGIVAFAVILCSSGVYPLLAKLGTVSGTLTDLERNLRSVQAVFLVAILALISYYRIPIGRNMKGMMGGYGLSIGTSLIGWAAYSRAGAEFRGPLGIWAVALWSYAPNPAEASGTRLDRDYERLVHGTRTALGTLRGYLGKA